MYLYILCALCKYTEEIPYIEMYIVYWKLNNRVQEGLCIRCMITVKFKAIE